MLPTSTNICQPEDSKIIFHILRRVHLTRTSFPNILFTFNPEAGSMRLTKPSEVTHDGSDALLTVGINKIGNLQELYSLGSPRTQQNNNHRMNEQYHLDISGDKNCTLC